MSRRTAFLAMVHIARKQMGWDDETYRSILKRTVNKYSSGDCTDAELRTLLTEFERLGWKKKPAAGAPKISHRAQVRMAYAIWADIRPLLEGDAGSALRSFVRRQTQSDQHPDGIAAPEFCRTEELTKVIEGLKGWRARLQKRYAA